MEFMLKPEDRADLSSSESGDPFDFTNPAENVGFNNPWVNQLIAQSKNETVKIVGILQNPFKDGGVAMEIVNQPYNTRFRVLNDGVLIEFIASINEEFQQLLRFMRYNPIITLEGRVFDSLLPLYPKLDVLSLGLTNSTEKVALPLDADAQVPVIKNWRYEAKLATKAS